MKIKYKYLKYGALIGVPVTALLSARAAIKCKTELDEKKPETTKDKAKIVVKHSILPVAAGGCTLFCVFGMDSAVKSSVEELTYISKKFFKYREQVAKEVGEEKAAEIEAAIAKEDWGVSVNGEVLPRGDDHELVNFSFISTDGTLTYFKTTVDRVKEAMYHLNRNFQLRGWCLLSELWEFIGITTDEYSDTHGWSYQQMAEWGYVPWIDYSLYEDRDGVEMLYFTFGPTHIYTWEED